MTKTEYQDYLQGDHWKRVRNRFKGCKCLGCATCEGITLHHVNYARLGNELDADLRPLCWSCHQEVHRLIDEGDERLSSTDFHIANIRKGFGLPALVDPKSRSQKTVAPAVPKPLGKKRIRKLRKREAELRAAADAVRKQHEAKMRDAAVSLAIYRIQSHNNVKGRTLPRQAREQFKEAIAAAPPKNHANPMLKIIKDIRRHRGVF